MDKNVAMLQAELDQLLLALKDTLNDLILLRRQSPQIKAETVKMLESYLIEAAKSIKELGKENQDDLLEGISLLKIKLMS